MNKSPLSVKARNVFVMILVAFILLFATVAVTGLSSQVTYVSTVDLSETVVRQFRIPFTNIILGQQELGQKRSLLFQQLVEKGVVTAPSNDGVEIPVAYRSIFWRDGETGFFKLILEQESKLTGWLSDDQESAVPALRRMHEHLGQATTSADLERIAEDVIVASCGRL